MVKIPFNYLIWPDILLVSHIFTYLQAREKYARNSSNILGRIMRQLMRCICSRYTAFSFILVEILKCDFDIILFSFSVEHKLLTSYHELRKAPRVITSLTYIQTNYATTPCFELKLHLRTTESYVHLL